MTEKRYIRVITGQIYDCKEDKWITGDWDILNLEEDDEVVNLLNEQHEQINILCTRIIYTLEENEQLKSICQDHKDHAMDFKADCGRLEKENDELKKENNNLKKALWEAEENYLYEAYYDNSARREDKLQNLKEDFKREYWND